MPELPEVECVRRGLLALMDDRVVRTKLHRRDVLVVPGDPPGGWSRSNGTTKARRATSAHLLAGATITNISRQGKQLAIHAHDGRTLAAHLGMTGAFELVEPGRRLASTLHVHASWWFETGRRLVFRDPRRFGGLWTYPDQRTFETARLAALGPDALTITASQLSDALADRKTSIKAALLDQRRLAGVGNIYADEALHLARIDPRREAGSLTSDESARLSRAIRAILRDAIERGGSTISSYRDPAGDAGTFATKHLVYGRGGRGCRACGQPLTQATIAQRTTVWCPACQR